MSDCVDIIMWHVDSRNSEGRSHTTRLRALYSPPPATAAGSDAGGYRSPSHGLQQSVAFAWSVPFLSPARAVSTPRSATWAQEIFSMGNLHSGYFLGPSNSFCRSQSAIAGGLVTAKVDRVGLGGVPEDEARVERLDLGRHAGARKVLGCCKKCKLGYAFLAVEYSYERLELVQLLGQLRSRLSHLSWRSFSSRGSFTTS